MLHTFRKGLAKLFRRRGLTDDTDCDLAPGAMEQLTLAAVSSPPRPSPAKGHSYPNKRNPCAHTSMDSPCTPTPECPGIDARSSRWIYPDLTRTP